MFLVNKIKMERNKKSVVYLKLVVVSLVERKIIFKKVIKKLIFVFGILKNKIDNRGKN